MDSDFRTRILLAAQVALLGEVTANMRAVEVEWSAERIVLRVFTDGEATEEAREDFDASAVTQFMAYFTDLEPMPVIDFEFVRCDAPARIPVRGSLVYARAEAETTTGDEAT